MTTTQRLQAAIKKARDYGTGKVPLPRKKVGFDKTVSRTVDKVQYDNSTYRLETEVRDSLF